MSLFAGIIITPFLIFFSKEFLVLMSAEPKIVDISKGFLQIVGSFLVFRLVILTCNGILRGAGNTKTPMKVTLVINCINILLNWLLIFGIGPFPKLGILGSAWSTAIAYTVGTGLLCTKLFSGKYALHIHIRQILQIHAESLRRIVRISIPATIDTVATQMGFLFFTKIVAIIGTVSLAAHQIAIRIESISFMPGFALAISTATLVGQSIGAKMYPLHYSA